MFAVKAETALWHIAAVNPNSVRARENNNSSGGGATFPIYQVEGLPTAHTAGLSLPLQSKLQTARDNNARLGRPWGKTESRAKGEKHKHTMKYVVGRLLRALSIRINLLA